MSCVAQRTYSFANVTHCAMCGASSADGRIIGMRMDGRQGGSPRHVSGIGVTIRRCGNCSLHYADPLPIPATLDQHYGVAPETYWTADKFISSPTYFRREIDAAKRMLTQDRKPRALDIGAGLGKAMIALERAGFTAFGIEPTAKFRDRAIEHFGIAPDRLALTSIEDADFAPDTFDFITFGAVLEHLYEPAASIEKALSWLRPGGIIQAEVPSSDHLMQRITNAFFRLRGTNYVTNLSPLHSPFHLYEFGLRSFQRHAERAGYEIAEYYYRVCSIRHAPKFLHAPLRWWMERTGTGMQLTVYLRKAS